MSAASVQEVLMCRANEGSKPGRRKDDFVVGLCIEGGGMRGVVSAGMVLALEQLGLVDCFDRVYGASAGAMNGAYMLAGQAAFGTTIYYEDINNHHFIDFRRALRGRPVVDVDFAVKRVMVSDKPLDCRAVLERGIPLTVVGSDVRTGKPVGLPYVDRKTFLEALRAGATMPLVAGPPYRVGDDLIWDASMTEPIPTRLALRDGCTHLLVLLTRPKGHFRSTVGWFERLFVVPWLARYSGALASQYVQGEQEYRKLLLDLQSEAQSEAPNLLLVQPLGAKVGKLEKRPSKLVDGARSGMNSVFSLFGIPSTNSVAVLQGFDQDGHRVGARYLPALSTSREGSEC